MPYARKKDSEHAEVVQAFAYYNWEVLDVSRAPLAVDLVVAHRIQRRVVLVEVKGKRGKLTEGQSEIFARWPGETAICRSLEDVARLTAKAAA